LDWIAYPSALMDRIWKPKKCRTAKMWVGQWNSFLDEELSKICMLYVMLGVQSDGSNFIETDVIVFTVLQMLIFK
jgi:hypothetical protein